MQTSTHRNSFETRVNPPLLRISNENGRQEQVQLVEGQSIFVGTGANCKIQLSGQDVCEMHCMFQLDCGQLFIQDWNTGSTFVNGNPIEDLIQIHEGDQIKVGSYLMNAELETSQNEVVPENEPGNTEAVVLENADDPDLDHEPIVDSEAAHSEPDFEELNTIDSFDPDSLDLTSQMPSTDDIALLHEEIEHLQLELAGRDELIMELQNSDLNPPLSTASDVSENETERLVQRLEDLIEELDSADQRILSLDEQLQMSEEANRAEREERKHLETWVADIEQLVSKKFAESQAEYDRMKQQTIDLKTQRDLALRQIEQLKRAPGSVVASDPNQEDTLLQQQVAELQECLKRKEAQFESLVEEQQEFNKSKYEQQIHEMDQKIRQMEVDASREKALIARQRAELSQVKSELEQRLGTKQVLGVGDVRVQAMRQHLRDLHDEEQQSKQERRERSLSGRISKLWRRLDSR